MPKIVLTDANKKFIRDNRLTMSSRQLAAKMGCSKTPIQKYMRDNGLTPPKDVIEGFRRKAMTGRTTFTKAEDQFIKANYLTMPEKTMATSIGRSGCGIRGRMRQMRLVVPKEIIERRKKESQYAKGRVPENKGKNQSEFMSPEAIERTKATRFKKGSLPHNYGNGEHLTKDGYIMLSIGEQQKRLKHIHEWEKVNGPLPESHCLICLDGVRTNTDPNNWKLISRSENMLRNSIHNYPTEIIPSMVLSSKIDNKLNQLQDGK